MPLIAGAKVVTAPAATDGAAAGRVVKSEGVTFLAAPPRAWEELIDTGLKPARSLRGLAFGETLPVPVVDAARSRCRVFWNAYGPAASAGACTLGRVEADGAPTAGRPLANTRVYVLDRDGQPAPINVAGELLIAGDTLATGYINRPDLTADTFVEIPMDPSPCLRTGARAAWRPDATLHLDD
jgi:non-ribosomal peptide synthetase component F